MIELAVERCEYVNRDAHWFIDEGYHRRYEQSQNNAPVFCLGSIGMPHEYTLIIMVCDRSNSKV